MTQNQGATVNPISRPADPGTGRRWEKLSIFLNFLLPKLAAPKEEDLSKGILETIDMDSYRVEKKTVVKIQLPDQDAEIGSLFKTYETPVK